MVALVMIFSLSFYITRFFYRYTGTPPELARCIITSLTSLTLILLIISRSPSRDEILRERIFKALEDISQGDFNIKVERDDEGHLDELVNRINKMAEDLGSIESMRQDFISNISHEFQSPLTSIGGYATLLRKEGANLQQIEYAGIIEQESKRLSKLSENLLLLSSLEIEEKGIVKNTYRLDRQIEDAVLLLEYQWSAKGIEPDTSFARVDFYGNEDLLKQVWINLLVNAIKFTPQDGEISVSLKVEGENIIVIITDTGIGIAPSDQIHIFERFYKADKSRDRALGGNGLGLSLVKKIVDLHDGRITVESELGEGTTFKVILPNRKA
jgi:signal transduction histidine kinase